MTTSVARSTSITEPTMLKQPMIEKLAAMRLLGMAEALKAQEQDPTARELSFLERFGLLVDQQWSWRENQALSRRLKNAGPMSRDRIARAGVGRTSALRSRKRCALAQG